MFFQALTLQLGYNATIVTIGAMLLGAAAGVTGSFLFLRKRALVSDAIAHATLPGIGLAFIIMVSLGGDGRSLAGLMAGAAASAGLGLMCVQWLAKTRLGEDAAIGAVLSVFFGFGVVLLTVIQSMGAGRQAGLDGFLLGSTAGMLLADAVSLAILAALVLLAVALLARQLISVAFDQNYASASGVPVDRMDLAALALALAVTVVGLKVVGLVLIVALLIIPAVSARFWTERAGRLAAIAGLFGASAAWVGAAASAVQADFPTGPVIVLSAFAIFVVSMAFAPGRGVLAVWIRHLRFQRDVHIRQGLLALAQGQPIFEKKTLRLLLGKGLARADGVPTDNGRARAAKALRDERRWQLARSLNMHEAAAGYDGMSSIETVLTPDQIKQIDLQISNPEAVA